VSRALGDDAALEGEFASALQEAHNAVERSDRKTFSASPDDYSWRAEVDALQHELTQLESEQGLVPQAKE
jgi:hypothetical protein